MPSRRSSTPSPRGALKPFAVRLERRPGERDHRWAHLLSGFVAARLDSMASGR